jgi:hypothetical protein
MGLDGVRVMVLAREPCHWVIPEYCGRRISWATCWFESEVKQYSRSRAAPGPAMAS